MKVRVSDYYGKMNYYRWMPESMFNDLERAWLAQSEYAEVSESDYNLMQKRWHDAVTRSMS